jgi:hypothetical protein
VPAPPAVVWERVASFEGVNDELMPIVRMTCPPEHRRIDPATVPLGRPWFRSWLLLFGVLPIDWDHLQLVAIDPPHGFHEDSTMLSQRRVVPAGDARARVGGLRRVYGPHRVRAALSRSRRAHCARVLQPCFRSSPRAPRRRCGEGGIA